CSLFAARLDGQSAFSRFPHHYTMMPTVLAIRGQVGRTIGFQPISSSLYHDASRARYSQPGWTDNRLSADFLIIIIP
ncbi:MAG: hypothetical protein IKP32_01405, partial [Clostridia bacterium]|nr:hypothetical protein [Clostridia bacterium]